MKSSIKKIEFIAVEKFPELDQPLYHLSTNSGGLERRVPAEKFKHFITTHLDKEGLKPRSNLDKMPVSNLIIEHNLSGEKEGEWRIFVTNTSIPPDLAELKPQGLFRGIIPSLDLSMLE